MTDHDIKNHIQRLAALEFKNKLVAAYIQLQKDHVDDVRNEDVIADLNKALGLNYKIQRLLDWRNGSVKCPARVEMYMRRWLLQYLFDGEMAGGLIAVLSLD